MQSPPQLEEGYFGQFGMEYKMISLGLNRKVDDRRLFSLGTLIDYTVLAILWMAL